MILMIVFLVVIVVVSLLVAIMTKSRKHTLQVALAILLISLISACILDEYIPVDVCNETEYDVVHIVLYDNSKATVWYIDETKELQTQRVPIYIEDADELKLVKLEYDNTYVLKQPEYKLVVSEQLLTADEAAEINIYMIN